MVAVSEPHSRTIICPTCGSPARLRFVLRSDTGPQLIGWSCDGGSGHDTPILPALQRAVADAARELAN